MRCPKCGYISFDRVTSCSKCETDVAELASSLKGTGFQGMNTFFLGTLLPDYMGTSTVTESSSLQDAADDLDISMDDLNNLGDIGDIPGEISGLDLGPSDADEEDVISLQGVVVPEVDLSDFGDTDFNTMPISTGQVEGVHAQPADAGGQLDLADTPDFNLDGVDFEEGGELADEMPGLDLELEEGEKTEIIDIGALDLGDDQGPPALDFSGIDLSLGEEEADEAVDSDLEDLDLGDLEMEEDSDLPVT